MHRRARNDGKTQASAAVCNVAASLRCKRLFFALAIHSQLWQLPFFDTYNSPAFHIDPDKGASMNTRKQVTVFLENKPGRLAQVLSVLAQSKINIVALSVMDRHEHGVLRLVTEDEAATAKALKTMNAS